MNIRPSQWTSMIPSRTEEKKAPATTTAVIRPTGDGFEGGTSSTSAPGVPFTSAQKAVLSQIKDPVERQRLEILFTLKNGGTVSNQALDRALSTGLTADQHNVLSRTKDPTQRARLESQFKLQNTANAEAFVRKVAHRLPAAQQQLVLSRVADPVLRMRLSVELDLRAGKPVSDARLKQALSASLTPTQQKLLASIQDPTQRAGLQAQMQLQNQRQVEGFLRKVGHRLDPAQQQLALGQIKDPAVRAQLEAGFRLRAGGSVTDQELARLLSPALTADQKSLLSKVKDPSERAQLEAQFKLQNQARTQKFAFAHGHRLTAAQQKQVLAGVSDPTVRAQLQATFALRSGQEVSDNELGPALSTALTADQKSLLSKVNDPSERKSMELQFKMANERKLVTFARKVGHLLSPAQQNTVLARVTDPSLRARLKVLWSTRSAS